LKKNKKIAMYFIWEGLPNPVREKVDKFSSAKELWDKLHDIYSSPIADSKNAKEDADKDQEELCSPCQTYSEDEEYLITIGMMFFFTCEKCRHLEIECHEGNEIEKLIEKEDNHEAELISALYERREENKSLKKKLMKQKESVHIFEESQQVIENLRTQLEEARNIEENLEYQKKYLEANIEAKKEEAEMREKILTDHLKEITNDLN
jgi:DNA repair exonuclease SbcCD ATPase subunit